jgi:hypothetical protein
MQIDVDVRAPELIARPVPVISQVARHRVPADVACGQCSALVLPVERPVEGPPPIKRLKLNAVGNWVAFETRRKIGVGQPLTAGLQSAVRVLIFMRRASCVPLAPRVVSPREKLSHGTGRGVGKILPVDRARMTRLLWHGRFAEIPTNWAQTRRALKLYSCWKIAAAQLPVKRRCREVPFVFLYTSFTVRVYPDWKL